jgi:methylated-DNA-[protein]-cysteine S-methyltransferase
MMASPIQVGSTVHASAEVEPNWRFCLFDTEIGCIGLAWSDRGITRLQLPEADRAATERRLCGRDCDMASSEPPARIARTIDHLRSYLRGKRTDFAGVVVDLRGIDAFRRRIYNAARTVGWGETTTYGALARLAGCPDGARAVGQSMARNPIPIIIPCHRVLASGGRTGGFSAFGGAHAKLRLLALEGVDPGHDTPLLPGLLHSGTRRRG